MKDEVLILQFPSKFENSGHKFARLNRQDYIIILQLPLWFSRNDYVKLRQTMNHAIQSRQSRYSVLSVENLACVAGARK